MEALAQPLAAYTALAALGVVVFGAFLTATRLRAGWTPYRTWLVMLPIIFAALWLGVWAWALLVTILSIYGFKEFARATGLYRERLVVVIAFLFGKLLGRRHWTVLSPNKTVEGSLGALAFSIAFAFVNWPLAFPELPWWGALGLGVIVGAGGQIGDLTLANFKRNVGIKDFGNLLPGHGGVLDRLNSLTLVAPVALHFVRFFFDGFP